MPEEHTGKDFEADSKTEIAFDGCELVIIAVVVIVTNVPGRTRATLSATASLLGFPLAGKLDLATAFVLGTDGCNCSS